MVQEKKLLANLDGIVSVKVTMAFSGVDSFDFLLCTDIITIKGYNQKDYKYLLLVKKAKEKKPDFFIYSSFYWQIEFSHKFGYGEIEKSTIVEHDLDDFDFFRFMQRAESLIRKRYNFTGKICSSPINFKNWDLFFSVYEENIEVTDVEYKNNVRERFLNFLFTDSACLNLSRLNINILPQEIYSLKGIRFLDLSYTHWDSINIKFIENDPTFEELESLLLNDCLLDSFDIDVSSLKNLKHLNLVNNYLFSLHDSVFKLQSLRTLNLIESQLEKLPDDLSGLLNLESLCISHCYIRRLPDSIGELRKLVFLTLDNLYIKDLPESIGNLKKMTLLSITGNNYLTKLPETIGNLNLVRLYLHENNLKVLPKSIGNLTNVTDLHLDRNSLIELPAEFTLMKNLSYVNLQGNKLESLPDDIFDMPNLEYINVRNNPNLDIDDLKNKLMKSERRFLIEIDA
jgi:hypothetical protein